MQPQHFTYDELTPLEQCIAEFMARQERRSEKFLMEGGITPYVPCAEGA